MSTARLRLPRATAVTVALIALASGAHALGGGTLPALPIMAVLSSLTLVGVMLVAGRQLTLTILGSLLVAGQALLHLAFTRLSVPGASLPSTFLSGHGAHAGHGGALLAPSVVDAAGGVVSVTPSMEMLLLHGLATAAVAMMLARGEAALIALAGWIRPLFRLPAAPTLPATAAPVPVSTSAAPSRRGAVRLPQRRGPPERAAH